MAVAGDQVRAGALPCKEDSLAPLDSFEPRDEGGVVENRNGLAVVRGETRGEDRGSLEGDKAVEAPSALQERARDRSFHSP
jgi:hypothetical protein